jgi:signal transduction histidine kinase/CheY-like chemotaxis protein
MTAVVVTMNRNLAVSQLVEIAEADNVALTRVLANSLWPRFGPYVTSVSAADVGELQESAETARIRDAIEEFRHDLPVLLKVKIYNLEGITVFSSEESQIGENKSENLGFNAAACLDKPASKISLRGKFSAFSGEVYDRTVVETYVPVRLGEGPIEGVLELYSDVTSLMEGINRAQMNLLIGLVLTFGVLYGALILIVRYADRILRNQYQEILDRDEDFRREKEKAEEAAQAESEFLANMSHEIRTPMTAMLGFAQALSDADVLAQVPGQRIRMVETIRQCGDHLLHIVDRILDRARLKAGRLEVEEVPFSPTAVVEEVLSLMRPGAEAKGLALELEVDASTPAAAEGDATRIRQILINLIGNAIKFTESGSIRVTLSYWERPSGATLQFEVIDTGIGMSPEQIDSIFEPFTQADRATARRHGGIGLGLTISKGLTALLGGTIDVESELGKGSLFCVNVPCAVVDRARLLEESGVVSGLEGRPRSKTTERAGPQLSSRILLAEDNRENQELIRDILEEAGAEVEVAENGAIAVESVRNSAKRGRPFDVILMDMQMPVLDGPEAAKTLRQMGHRGPILALTAHAMETDRQKCLEAGCDDYLAKPVDRRRLIRLIAQHIDS